MLNGLYADALLPEGSPGALPNRADLREVLFEQWTKRDLTGAIEALTNVPNFPGPETLRLGGGQHFSILEQWLSVRPDEASAYARAMPAGAGHDHAIQSISEKVLLGSSEEIARWWSDLAAGDRKIARGVFDKTKLSDERRQKLDAALKGR